MIGQTILQLHWLQLRRHLTNHFWMFVLPLIYLFVRCAAQPDTLLSIGRPTNAANVYGYTSDKAVDGNTDGSMGNGFCYHSEPNNFPKWWLVVLDQVSVITKAVIYSRTDGFTYRTSFLMFFASSNNNLNYDPTSADFYNVKYYPGPPPPGEVVTTINFTRLVARTIGISKPYEADAINLCEFQIYGHPLVKPNQLIYKFNGPYAFYSNATSFKNVQASSMMECAIFCQRTFNCISFTMQGWQCMLYNHNGGAFGLA